MPPKKRKTKTKRKPPVKRKATPTPAQLHQVYKWILEGNDTEDIAEAIAEHWPGLAVAAVLPAARDKLVEAAEADPAIVAGWAIASARELYRRMVAIGDYVGALKALRTVADLTAKYGDIPTEPETAEEDAREET